VLSFARRSAQDDHRLAALAHTVAGPSLQREVVRPGSPGESPSVSADRAEVDDERPMPEASPVRRSVVSPAIGDGT
jgi:hypothetical protein